MTRFLTAVMLGAAAPMVPASMLPADDRAVAQANATAEITTRVQKEMSREKIVGLAVAVSDGQSIVYSGYFGLADREANLPVTESTMFRWASVAKPLTAVAAMQLATEGKLDLDKDVRELVPEFPAKPHVITTAQLLTHQGGIVHYGNGPVIRTERTYDQPNPFKSVILALDTFKDSPLVCEPGEKHSYTTHGYILLSAVVERAAAKRATGADGSVTWTGPSFAELVQQRIASPLGMTTLRPDYQWEEIPNRTAGYRGDKKKDPERSTDTDVSWKLGGGGYISTVVDMAKFGGGMLSGRLVDAETRQRMWTEQPTRDGEVTSYGLGFGIGRRDGRVLVHHSGGQEKTSTFLLMDPAALNGRGVAVAVMCNTEGRGLGGVARDIADIVDEHLSAALPVAEEKR